MSIRGRAMLGAILLAGGLLVVVSGSVYKGTEFAKYQRDLKRGSPDLGPPNTTVWNILMAVGWIAAAGGAVLVGFAARDMTRQIGDIQSRAESQMRMEAAAKRDEKPKT